MIAVNQLTKYFNKGKANEVLALNQVSLQIATGEFIVVVGANGSGKSTFLNLLAGVITPNSGSITLEQTEVAQLPEYKRSKWIARVFQNPLSGTAPDLSILDNFRLAALRTQSKKLSIGIDKQFKQQVHNRIATLGMGLEDKLDLPMGALSGGQRQALTMLMAVMDHTRILLLDEPTAALDPRSAERIMQMADQLTRQYQLTTVLVTHQLKAAFEYGDRIIQFAEGNIINDLNADNKSKLTQTDLYDWFI